MRQVLGTELSPSARLKVLRDDNRFTCETVPDWARRQVSEGKYPAPQYRTDFEWLANTSFTVNNKGSLSKSMLVCESKDPSWPLGVWLDNPYELKGDRQ